MCPRGKDPEISGAAGSLEQHDPMRDGSLDRAFSGLEIITSPPLAVVAPERHLLSFP